MGIQLDRRALAAALAALMAATTFGPAEAGSADYEFELVENEVKQGATATVAVRLVDKRNSTPITDAVIFATRMDMAPDGMEAMTTTLEAMPSDQPGVYRFKTNLMMAGGWRFSVAAKLQGEPDTVESRLVFKAVP
ncbi:FixH family protein [Mesorhizobium sp.]|uniref:FixH family protein n=1 Tax=Mesorhizobium sp. TaxID=1871066 RepID=UPI000FE936A5|nr:FixH family protein [Mesorhizobium sp.]RWA97372.1 MAG: heavy metal RND transporter [Mesorhizobium sp.]